MVFFSIPCSISVGRQKEETKKTFIKPKISILEEDEFHSDNQCLVTLLEAMCLKHLGSPGGGGGPPQGRHLAAFRASGEGAAEVGHVPAALFHAQAWAHPAGQGRDGEGAGAVREGKVRIIPG